GRYVRPQNGSTVARPVSCHEDGFSIPAADDLLGPPKLSDRECPLTRRRSIGPHERVDEGLAVTRPSARKSGLAEPLCGICLNVGHQQFHAAPAGSSARIANEATV